MKLNVEYRQVDRYWFEYARAKLLAKTFDGLMNRYRICRAFYEKQQDKFVRTKLKINSGGNCMDDDCPFCREAVRGLIKHPHIKLDELPPFHPGCGCWVSDELEEL